MLMGALHQIPKINTLPATVTEELHACMCKYASTLIKVTHSTNSVQMTLLFQHFLCNMKQHPTLKLLSIIRILIDIICVNVICYCSVLI